MKVFAWEPRTIGNTEIWLESFWRLEFWDGAWFRPTDNTSQYWLEKHGIEPPFRHLLEDNPLAGAISEANTNDKGKLTVVK